MKGCIHCEPCGEMCKCRCHHGPDIMADGGLIETDTAKTTEVVKP